jgi:hypothetical protein
MCSNIENHGTRLHGTRPKNTGSTKENHTANVQPRSALHSDELTQAKHRKKIIRNNNQSLRHSGTRAAQSNHKISQDYPKEACMAAHDSYICTNNKAQQQRATLYHAGRHCIIHNLLEQGATSYIRAHARGHRDAVRIRNCSRRSFSRREND